MVAPSRYGVELLQWIGLVDRKIAALQLAVGSGDGGSGDPVAQIEQNTTRIVALEKSVGDVGAALDAIIGGAV